MTATNCAPIETAEPRMLHLKAELPAELPTIPVGWTRTLLLHVKFGLKGAAHYRVMNPEGDAMPFGYQYDQRPDGINGYTMPGVAEGLTWAQLVCRWPAYYASLE